MTIITEVKRTTFWNSVCEHQ